MKKSPQRRGGAGGSSTTSRPTRPGGSSKQRGFTTPPTPDRQARGPPAMSDLWQPLGLSLRIAGVGDAADGAARHAARLRDGPPARSPGEASSKGSSCCRSCCRRRSSGTSSSWRSARAAGSTRLARRVVRLLDRVPLRRRGARGAGRRAADALHARQGRVRVGRPRPGRRREDHGRQPAADVLARQHPARPARAGQRRCCSRSPGRWASSARR